MEIKNNTDGTWTATAQDPIAPSVRYISTAETKEKAIQDVQSMLPKG
jgi:hypothetical protein